MGCKVQGCPKKVKYPSQQLCNWHYSNARSLATLDDMIVRPCLGECGKRVHNKACLIVPGITQGHGPKRAYCSACAKKRVPDPNERHVSKDRGECRRCERKMQAGRRTGVEEGYVPHWGRGLCRSCYGHFYAPRDVDKVKKLRALNPQKVAVIKRRLLNGDRQVDIMQDYHISKDSMYRIANNQSWRNVNAAPDTN